MLKLRKIFSLGLAAALGLIALSCVEPVDYWTVYMMTGTIDEYGDTTLSERTVLRTDYIEGDYVTINAGKPYYGKKFYMWTSLPAVDFDNVEDSTTRFLMPGQDVVVTAWFIDAVTTKLEPKIRYTWEAEQLPNIHMISASYEDVDDWYEEVYYRLYADLPNDEAFLHISHRPLGEGSELIPNGIYVNFTMGTEYNTENKGVYFPIAEGDDYTAICTVIDPVLKDTFDIVANYDVRITGNKAYFEVGFDVALFLDPTLNPDPDADPDDPDPDLWVLKDAYDTSTHAPMLEKKKAAKLLKKLKKGDVTYYVFRRASK
jgi:hypothetical protein